MAWVLILPCNALVLRVFSPSAHLRMTNFPENPIINPTFLNPGGSASSQLDLTGVGWSVQDPRKQFALVSPRHFVGANHFRPAVGSQVRFLASDGTLHHFTIGKISGIPNADSSPSDVFLGEFTSEVPATAAVSPLPYLNLASEEAYIGEPLIATGQAARGGRGTIGSVSDFGGDPLTGSAGFKTRAFTFSYGPVGGNADAHAETGDSGSPSLVLRSGKAALVGTHTAVLQALGTVTTYDTLVPHYVPEINLQMEASGLRLRKINPAATSFSAAGTPLPNTVRSGKPFTYRITLTNGANVAENVVADLAKTSAVGPATVSAPGWHSSALFSIRRGALAAGAAAEVELSFGAAPASGPAQISFSLKSDGSPLQNFDLPFPVLPSFAEWAEGLEDAALSGDSDGDGIPNLLEYAFGGDNLKNSQFFPGMEPNTKLLPALSRTPFRLSFLRRTDAAERGLTYAIESSATLDSGDWQTLPDVDVSVISNPVPGFEEVSATLSAPTEKGNFYRLRIELNE